MASEESETTVTATDPPVTPLQTGINPIQKKDRIQTLDVLRGLAIFGIFLLNIQFFAYPEYGMLAYSEFYPGIWNKIVKWFVSFFVQTKFYSMFSLLFGIGMAVLWDRCQKKGIGFGRFFARRLFILLIIGLIHGFLIWDGDILMTYAIIGFLLLAFQRRKQKTIIIWVIVSFIIPILMMTIGSSVMILSDPDMQDPVKIAEKINENKKKAIESGKKELEVFQQGTFQEQLAHRAKVTAIRQSGAIFYGWQVLSMFLLGIWIWRKGIFQQPAEHLPLIRKTLKLGLLIGVPANLAFVVSGAMAGPETPYQFLYSMVAGLFGAPALCLAYVALITLLMQKTGWQQRLAPFSSVGRMALSNYLFQTLVCTTLFYSYGFALFGKLSPAIAILLVPLIYTIQVYLSNRWLKYFRFGPVEWLWRSLTYKKRQPMRLDQHQDLV